MYISLITKWDTLYSRSHFAMRGLYFVTHAFCHFITTINPKIKNVKNKKSNVSQKSTKIEAFCSPSRTLFVTTKTQAFNPFENSFKVRYISCISPTTRNNTFIIRGRRKKSAFVLSWHFFLPLELQRCE